MATETETRTLWLVNATPGTVEEFYASAGDDLLMELTQTEADALRTQDGIWSVEPAPNGYFDDDTEGGVVVWNNGADFEWVPRRIGAFEVACMTDCAYCGARVPEGRVPGVDDDNAWEDMAVWHADDCEWVATRAHRQEEN